MGLTYGAPGAATFTAQMLGSFDAEGEPRDHLSEARAQRMGYNAARALVRKSIGGVASLFGLPVAEQITRHFDEGDMQVSEMVASYEAAMMDVRNDVKAAERAFESIQRSIEARDQTVIGLRALLSTIVAAERKRMRPNRPIPDWFEAAREEC